MSKDQNEIPNPASVPEITQENLDRLRARRASIPREPLFPAGTVTRCPRCGGEMVTTNNLRKIMAGPRRVIVVTRLPGAQCLQCRGVQFDPYALAIIEESKSEEIIADYETTVTKASGKTLGTYFKVDLVRVLALTGKEQLLWKVLDRNAALVEIQRAKEASGERQSHRSARVGLRREMGRGKAEGKTEKTREKDMAR